MPSFLPGVELSRLFYTEAVRPLLGSRPHAAARLGPGSDVLGFDTARSTDHDWGPRLELFTDEPGGVGEMLSRRLPQRFWGWSTHFEPQTSGVRAMADTDGPVAHYVTVTGFAAWSRRLLGFDPRDELTLTDWLATPWQRFAEQTGGAVFHDPGGVLGAVRERLRWYPDDVWRYVLDCQWALIDQEEPFAARAAEDGDELGSLVATARLTREAGRLLLLLSRRWPPYQKWVMRALGDDLVAPHLLRALRDRGIRGREDALCTALELAATRQNALKLAAPQSPTRRLFFDRGYAVIGAGRFAEALRAEITDPVLRSMPLTGCVDQFVDNTAVLTSPALARALFTALESRP